MKRKISKADSSLKLKIKHKLAISHFLTSLLAMTLIAAVSYLIAKKALEQQTFSKLTAIRNSKSLDLKHYFNTLKDQAGLISDTLAAIRHPDRPTLRRLTRRSAAPTRRSRG